MHWAVIDELRRNLRERRVKENLDYSLTFKYGQLRFMCHAVYLDVITEECERLGLTVTQFLIYE